MNPLVDRRTLLSSSLAVAASQALPALARPAASTAAPKPWGAVPSPRQLRWHGLEQYAFVHFGLNTWTGREWGYGDEDPSLFNPTDFDADRIVAAAKSAELRGVILTAKHHDGFCLWPTPLTEHCIRNSPYKGGKGDIVREVSDACRRAGLPFGIYLSPWDRNRADYGTPPYVAYFRAQLTDLCTHYGELFELWFDGANGGDGYYGGARETRKIDSARYYDWRSIIALAREMQPRACTFDPVGSDIRWLGNESGIAGDPCWPTMPADGGTLNQHNGGVRNGPMWWPAETGVSIRPGWFYRPEEDARVKSPTQLVAIYDQSVGRGTNLVLNLAPNKSGRIPAPDLASFKGFGESLRATFRTDLAKGAVATASSTRAAGFGAAKVLDGSRDSYWCSSSNDKTPSLVLDLPPDRAFNLIRLREYLPLGVRVARFAVDVATTDGSWREIASHEGIGAQRLISLGTAQKVRRIRLRIVEADAPPAISEIALFHRPPLAPDKPVVLSGSYDLDRAKWTIVTATAPEAERLIQKGESPWVAKAPASVTIDLGALHRVTGITITPAAVDVANGGPPGRFLAETSIDGQMWTATAEGELSNIVNARTDRWCGFTKPSRARLLRVTLPNSATGDPLVVVQAIGAVAIPEPAQ